MTQAAQVTRGGRTWSRAVEAVVESSEAYLQARPEKAKAYGAAVIDRALEGVEGLAALHTCVGYAHVVKKRLTGYPFFGELNGCKVDQLSIEAAQPRLDLAILREVPDKTIILGVLDLDDMPASV